MRSGFAAGAVWPASNRALYLPVEVQAPCTAYQFIFNVVTQSGNYDVGIYDEQGKRLVSKGSTAVPVAGVCITDITDTELTPGVYFLAMNVDNTTAAFNRTTNPTAAHMQCCGCQQQAVGAVTLPDPATFANPATAYVPALAISTYEATI